MHKPHNFSDADWLAKAKIDVMRDDTFCVFSGVLSCGGGTVLTPTVPRARTDGWHMWFNPEFVRTLTIQQLRFTVLHEALHVAFRHLHIYRDLFKENRKLANVATDMFINLTLLQTDGPRKFLDLPANVVLPDPQYTGMSARQIYERMKQNAQSGGGGGGGGGDGDDGDGFDEHDWDGAATATPEEQQARETEIARAVRQGEVIRQRSKRGAGNADGVFGELLRPKIDWRQVLREFLREATAGRDESTWRKPNRRYLSDGVYLPSMISERLDEIVIGFDTSGSCFGTQEMTAFVSEVRSIVEDVRPSKTHVIYWDTAVAGHQEFTDGQFAVADLKPRGGGGTNGAVLFDYLREKRISPVAVVQLTDGMVGNWGRSDWPTLWAITTDIRAQYGTTVPLKLS